MVFILCTQLSNDNKESLSIMAPKSGNFNLNASPTVQLLNCLMCCSKTGFKIVLLSCGMGSSLSSVVLVAMGFEKGELGIDFNGSGNGGWDGTEIKTCE